MALKWEMINEFLLQCGSRRTPEELGDQIIDTIGRLIPFDQGRLYFLDGNGKVCRERLIRVKKKESMEYHDYYSKLDEGRFSTPCIAVWFAKNYPSVEQCVFSRPSYGSSRFYNEYIKPHHIKHSFGLGLRDAPHSLKCMLSLDRTSDTPYSGEEVRTMEVIRPHLDNMLQNLYVTLSDEPAHALDGGTPLTQREGEIAKLLAEGVTPHNISVKLCISYTTVKKHMDNIYKKLNVNTRQELMLKLMKRQEHRT